MNHRVLILGAAGRDFHVFNTVYRDDPSVRVVAFTAQQIPHIDGRRYPPELAGPDYPEGIPILPEDELEAIITREGVTRCVMAYSDVSHEYVMHMASRVNAAGPDFEMGGAARTMLPSTKPVVAVCASRTGVGKSQTSRAVANILREAGLSVAVVRHPMPYGDLLKQRVQRFAGEADLVRYEATIEEREEYEPHIANGSAVFAGVDYEAILRAAEAEADVVLWDGGNNDTSFFRADVYITLVDPHRPGHELGYYPGETNLRLADVVVVNKVDTAPQEGIAEVLANVARVNPAALVIQAASPLTVDDPSVLRGKKVLVVEDGPTLTHGGMKYGAGTLGAQAAGAAEIVDPRPYLVGELADTFEKYPGLGTLLPAMGYGPQQVADLEATLRNAAEGGVEAVAVGTPIDLARLVEIPVPFTRVRYDLLVKGEPTLEEALRPVLTRAAQGAAV
ncbi:MAG TPA: cyclic 2,3-diphosphoglycerate synthase [Longimicrobiales bacterium]|nr:cyclic 2,3-diphosphoglycerate synthase [Longimicrobiales bacterium]